MALPTGKTLMIDNYDSFTHNLYQFLGNLGADVQVVRNDQITIPEIDTLFQSGLIRNIVISPGPGHPSTDSGISRDVIRWGLGKLPILGVCMGLQCLVHELGGEISYAGEILHGKTSLVKHDARGLFHSLPQNIKCTRYHSLAASILTLPADLQVTSTTVEAEGDKGGVVMGVRHRKYAVEAVQYHPESVLSEHGMELMGNFLKLKGATWDDNREFGVGQETIPTAIPSAPTSAAGPLVANGTHSSSSSTTTPSDRQSNKSITTILTQIYAQRLSDVQLISSHPSSTPAQLQTNLSLHLSPPLIPLIPRITTSSPSIPAVFAEVKRASPSKGSIAPDTNAATQALTYAHAGASVISVLTEPKWFKGSLQDMLSVRLALGQLPNRPAVLRKDFILDKYQIDEARLYGADTVLLIVAMLDPVLLQELYDHSVSLGMEPLVEVNNPEELKLALSVGAKVIGVNNRNLHDFEVDMGTTSRVADALKEGAASGGHQQQQPLIIALSGITGRESVEGYLKEGVRGLLVGEYLMRASDPKAFIRELLALPPPEPSTGTTEKKPLVKICGVQSRGDAQVALDAGADFVGIILVEGSKRCVTIENGLKISEAVHEAAKKVVKSSLLSSSVPSASAEDQTPSWFEFSTTLSITADGTTIPRLVGVFQNQPLAYILHMVQTLTLDVVQLHGSEPAEWSHFIPVPVIKVFHVSPTDKSIPTEITRPGLNNYVLLDAASASGGAAGGTGESFDWTVTSNAGVPFLLAGGLNPENVREAVSVVKPWAVDVSSGVEYAKDTGKTGKDPIKVKEFIQKAKA